MAKKIISTIANYSLADVVSVKAFNVDRKYTPYFKDDKERNSLVIALLKGYKPELGLVIIFKMTDVERKQAEEQIRSEIEALRIADKTQELKYLIDDKDEKQKRSLSDKAVAEYMESLYFDKSGNFKPKFASVSANRRVAVMPYVVLSQRLYDLPEITELPCQLREYENTFERDADCLAENELKVEGAKPVSAIDQVATAWRFYSEGNAKQSLFRKYYKVGTGQKNYWLCELIKKATTSLSFTITVEEILDGFRENYKYSSLTFDNIKKFLNTNPTKWAQYDAFLKMPNPPKSVEDKVTKPETLKEFEVLGFLPIAIAIDYIRKNDAKGFKERFDALREDLNASFRSLIEKHNILTETETETEKETE